MDNKKKYTVLAGIAVVVIIFFVICGFFLFTIKKEDVGDLEQNGVSTETAAIKDDEIMQEEDNALGEKNSTADNGSNVIDGGDDGSNAENNQFEGLETEDENQTLDNFGEIENSVEDSVSVGSDVPVLPDASPSGKGDTSSKEEVSVKKPEVTIVPDNYKQDILDYGIKLPYVIPETSLVIEQINPYSGVFVEAGLDQKVDNTIAVVVRNAGTQCVEYMNITMQQADRILTFTGSALEAGARMVIMETNASAYWENDYTSCQADVAYMSQVEMSTDVVKVEQAEEGGLVVTNISKQDIPCVRIFYKFYMDDVDVYIGGITYNAKVENLRAGESRTIVPSHYVKNSSKIVMIKTYETADD